MRNEIWILFVVYSLNFPSRFYARAFVFRAWKGISLKARSKNRKGKEKKRKNFKDYNERLIFLVRLQQMYLV